MKINMQRSSLLNVFFVLFFDFLEESENLCV